MIILGLNHGEINSSAAVIKDGIVVAGSPEERFNRQQKTKSFPKQAVEFCLKTINIKLHDCDCIAQGWNPGAYWQNYNQSISSTRIKREDYLYTIVDNLYSITDRIPPKWVLMSLSEKNLPPIYYVQHHLTHAANAFFLSPFKKAAILTCDWRGEFETTTLGLGQENKIDIIATQSMPHSLGMFYATYTELLGYRRDNDEWKVMALSAFDVDYREQLEKIRSTIKLTDDGLFELDQSYYQGALLEKPQLHTEKLTKLLNYDKNNKSTLTESDYAIAKAMQIVAEEITTHILNHLYKKTLCENVVLGGGFFMNSVFNGKVTKKTPFKNIYISHSPADVGNSIGAALYVAHCIHNQNRSYQFNTSYLGPSFSNDEIQTVLERRKIKYDKVDNIEKKIATILADDQIIAVFNGRSEFGERALGNRSILADPRKAQMKDRINSAIKYRESYRPFAPSVLQEKVHIIFDVPEGFESNFMEKVVPIKKEFHEKVAAITHFDGSGRLQTVKKEHNKHFHEIISEFENITGLPVVLNTSFNINGEPIVLSPDDALNTFYNSGLEYLIMNNFLIRK
jgi:carbamoyltransferase